MRSLIIAMMANLSFASCVSQGPFFQTDELEKIVSQARSSGDIIGIYGPPVAKELVLAKKKRFEPSGEPINDDELATLDHWAQEAESHYAEEDKSLDQEFLHDGEQQVSCPEAEDSITYLSQRLGWLISVEEKLITIYLDKNARACGYQVQTFIQSI